MKCRFRFTRGPCESNLRDKSVGKKRWHLNLNNPDESTSPVSAILHTEVIPFEDYFRFVFLDAINEYDCVVITTCNISILQTIVSDLCSG